jgi:hypothetical protein
MTKFKPLPPVERLREVFEVDESGQLKWKKRPHAKCWNIDIGGIAGSTKEDGYWRVTLDGSHYYCHRIVWKMFTGVDPGELEVDHVNKNRSDNRICNLRLVTTRQNSFNRGGAKTSKTKIPCVFYTRSRRSPFKVVVNSKHIGSFQSVHEAIRARDEYKLAVLRGEGML